MANQLGDLQKMSQSQIEQMSATAASVARGIQAIAAETTDYSKRSVENTSSFMEKLFGAKSIDTAVQLQTEFAKSQFEGMLAQTRHGQGGVQADRDRHAARSAGRSPAAVIARRRLGPSGLVPRRSLQAIRHLKGSTDRAGLSRFGGIFAWLAAATW